MVIDVTALTPLDTLWLTETIRLREEQAGALEDQEANRRPAPRAVTCARASPAVPCGWPSVMA
jgi:hypothetical protein